MRRDARGPALRGGADVAGSGLAASLSIGAFSDGEKGPGGVQGAGLRGLG